MSGKRLMRHYCVAFNSLLFTNLSVKIQCVLLTEIYVIEKNFQVHTHTHTHTHKEVCHELFVHFVFLVCHHPFLAFCYENSWCFKVLKHFARIRKNVLTCAKLELNVNWNFLPVPNQTPCREFC